MDRPSLERHLVPLLPMDVGRCSNTAPTYKRWHQAISTAHRRHMGTRKAARDGSIATRHAGLRCPCTATTANGPFDCGCMHDMG